MLSSFLRIYWLSVDWKSTSKWKGDFIPLWLTLHIARQFESIPTSLLQHLLGAQVKF